MINQAFLSSSAKWDWETPPSLWRKIDPIFNFKLDAAASPNSAKCEKYITPKMDALSMDWEVSEGEHWWLNPPWGNEYKKETGRSIGLWMHHALKQYRKGYEGVAIVSARLDTQWFHNFCKPAPFHLFPLGRIKFIDPETGKIAKQPTFPSVLVIYINELTKTQIDALRCIGWLVSGVAIPPKM